MDTRRLSAHGKRFLSALSGAALVFNGLVELGFDNAFTRMPNRLQDCHGVLDYVFGPPSMLKLLQPRSLKIVCSPPDFSDHYPVGLGIDLGLQDEPTLPPESEHFHESDLTRVVLPREPGLWEQLDQEVCAHPGFQEVCREVADQQFDCNLTKPQAQQIVDKIVQSTTNAIQDVFRSNRLMKCRRFGADGSCLPANAKHTAPPKLQRARAAAATCEKSYRTAVANQDCTEIVKSAKSRWNSATAECRRLSRLARAKFCLDWSACWKQMRRSNGKNLWRTFRSFTNMPSEECTCSLDAQWEHWATQGDTVESVWTNQAADDAKAWCDWLRCSNLSEGAEPAVLHDEAEKSRVKMRPGKAAGKDGIPSDVIRNLPSLTLPLHMLFTLIVKFGVYPVDWGVALVRALLKPGKPKTEPTSLRGIRLVSGMASWFGRVFDNRARTAWQAGPEQFGFRCDTGCGEAVALILALIYSRIYARKRLFVLWVDLRTAFPSLNRHILVRKMFLCGVSLALCRTMLAILDATSSLVCIGSKVGALFSDILGVREGAVESPHAFNMYVSDLRSFLEGSHPHLCRLLGVVIAIILYADDAALPADSVEDLQMLAQLFESFCNDNRLYISTPKSFVTVFHPPNDTGVCYSDGQVSVDGHRVEIKIYGQLISAADTFKYLGVVLDSCGSHHAHVEARVSAFQRSAHLLLAGLSRIPSFPHSFASYLWMSLVKPVGNYGMELFVWPEPFVQRFRAQERKFWRKLLQVGGRSPNATVQILMGETHCDTTWRTARAALLLKLLNAPAGSWQHLAAIAHHHLLTPWFRAALEDLHVVFPNVRLVTTFVGAEPFLSSSGSWTDEGDWASFHARRLPVNTGGQRFRPQDSWTDPDLRKITKAHIKRIVSMLRVRLNRDMWSTVYQNVVESSLASESSKMTLVALCLQAPGPPLHIAIDLIHSVAHRCALASFLCGDWHLGKYAHNYFAKSLLPSLPRHVSAVNTHSIDASTVCLACWHHRRALHFEDEFHVVSVCPEYSVARNEMLSCLEHSALLNSQHDLATLLSGSSASSLQAAARFLARARQIRRRRRVILESYSQRLEKSNFAAKKAAWRLKGKYACRHGVLFSAAPTGGCKCMSAATSTETDWELAKFMPWIDPELKAIVAVPFMFAGFVRLGSLQSQLRQSDP